MTICQASVKNLITLVLLIFDKVAPVNLIIHESQS